MSSASKRWTIQARAKVAYAHNYLKAADRLQVNGYAREIRPRECWSGALAINGCSGGRGGRAVACGSGSSTTDCAMCHAVRKSGRSPHPAAPFRTIGAIYNLEELTELLEKGIVAGHPDMPSFKFSRGDASAVTSYLRSIQN